MLRDYTQFWSKFLKFDERSNQREYVVPMVVNMIFEMILLTVTKILMKPSTVPTQVNSNIAAYQQTAQTASKTPMIGVLFMAILVAFSVIIFIGTLSVTSRRLKDIGFNPMYSLGVLIPIVNFIQFVLLATKPSLGFSESEHAKISKRKWKKTHEDFDAISDLKHPTVDVKVVEKVSWQKKITSKKLSAMFIELRYTDAEWHDRIQKRIVFTLACLIMTMVIASFVTGKTKMYVILGGLALSGYAYYDTYAKVKRSYRNYIFAKQVEFSKFMRTVIPYLMNKSDRSFIAVLETIVNRMKVEQNLNLRKKVYDMDEVVSSSSESGKTSEKPIESSYDDDALFEVEHPEPEPEPILNSYVKHESIDLMDSDVI